MHIINSRILESVVMKGVWHPLPFATGLIQNVMDQLPCKIIFQAVYVTQLKLSNPGFAP